MRNVYVLGSGFSAGCGLPTLKTLFHELLNQNFKQEIEHVRFALELLYPHMKRNRKPDSYPPFEEFLSLCFSAIDFEDNGNYVGAYDKGYWQKKYTSAVTLLTHCLLDKSTLIKLGSDQSKLLETFVNNLNDDDVIITFNWDTLIEKTLMKTNRSFTLKGRENGKITLLKLHGSLSWFKIPSGKKIDESILEKCCEPLAEDEALFYSRDHHNLFETWSALDELPYIVTPITAKSPVRKCEFMTKLWYEAFNSLFETQMHGGNIIFIGYSLPPDDLHAKTLFKSSLLSRRDASDLKPYILIDPDPMIAERFFTQISPDFYFFQKKFSGDELKILEQEQELEYRKNLQAKKKNHPPQQEMITSLINNLIK